MRNLLLIGLILSVLSVPFISTNPSEYDIKSFSSDIFYKNVDGKMERIKNSAKSSYLKSIEDNIFASLGVAMFDSMWDSQIGIYYNQFKSSFDIKDIIEVENYFLFSLFKIKSDFSITIRGEKAELSIGEKSFSMTIQGEKEEVSLNELKEYLAEIEEKELAEEAISQIDNIDSLNNIYLGYAYLNNIYFFDEVEEIVSDLDFLVNRNIQRFVSEAFEY